jgi:putative endonuclease
MTSEKLYYVYILASRSRAIYVGMTGFLMNRVLSHRAGAASDFTRKYKIYRLVYYEVFHSIAAAIGRETEIKKWRREKKIALIVQKNPTWEDLACDWGKPGVMRVDGQAGSRSTPSLRSVPQGRLSPCFATVRNDIALRSPKGTRLLAPSHPVAENATRMEQLGLLHSYPSPKTGERVEQPLGMTLEIIKGLGFYPP